MPIRTWMIVACFAASGALVACGGDREKHTARPVTPIDPATTGTVEVDVGFDGTPSPSARRSIRVRCRPATCW